MVAIDRSAPSQIPVGWFHDLVHAGRTDSCWVAAGSLAFGTFWMVSGWDDGRAVGGFHR